MQIRRLNAQTVALEDLDPFCWRLLKNIVRRADPEGNPAAEARLFSTPTHGVEPHADAEWKEYVEPDLRHLFQDTLGIVAQDLEIVATAANEPPDSLHLPVNHLEAWIHAMNQARLALAARFALTEADMEQRVVLDTDPRSVALFEVRFYGLLQEFFLNQLEAEDD